MFEWVLKLSNVSVTSLFLAVGVIFSLHRLSSIYLFLAPQITQAEAPTEQPIPDLPAKADESKSDDKAKKIVDSDILKTNEFDPLNLTEEELKILTSLHKEKKKIEKERGEIESKKRLVEALKKKADERFKELQEIKKQIDDDLARREIEDRALIENLVKVYENMKPQAAAQIWASIEIPTLVKIARLMKESKLSQILTNMPPDHASELTYAITKMAKMK